MTKGILGKKVGMTQIFTESGEFIPVTVIEATPNVVLQVKTVETDGYEAVQVGFDDKREVLSNKPAKGHVAKANTAPKRFIREFKNIEGLEVGQEITVDTFSGITCTISRFWIVTRLPPIRPAKCLFLKTRLGATGPREKRYFA